MSRRIVWTPDVLDQVRAHAEAGHTMAVCAAAIGSTTAAVSRIASQHKIHFHGKRQPYRALDVGPALEKARRELAQARRERPSAPLYRGRLQ